MDVEFKECIGGISKTVYEIVCAFLNTKGEDILLGVRDKGKIVELIESMPLKSNKNFSLL
ncbi:MAG: ATP-binding protein [Endomicrobium sp.]|nr:ATP-binding protein [Endomicrobium sp.]